MLRLGLTRRGRTALSLLTFAAPGLGAVGLALALAGCGAAAGRPGQPPGPGPESLALPDALVQLDALALPGGADARSFAQLKARFRSMLESSGTARFTSAPPSAAGGTVEDLLLTAGGAEVSLGWTYANRGDYDQNSEVNISDISPLGAHYGKGASAPDWDSQARIADGDGNAEVNIADLTPIGAGFLASVDGYRVQASLTPAVESSWEEVAQLAFAEAALAEDSPFLTFSHTLAAPVLFSYYRVLPYQGAVLGPPSNAVQYSLAPPVIVSVAPLTGDTGTAVQFSAGFTGGAPQTFAWDFGGGAEPATSSLPQPTVTLGAIAAYDASLTVANAAGSDTFAFSLAVTQVDPPQINSVTPQTGVAGTAIGFTAFLSGGAVATYGWDFGGGASPPTSSAASPTVMLAGTGSYDASLTVTNGGGTDTFPFTLLVYQPPSASFTATPQSGDPGEVVALDASASSDDGSLVKYEWDLDGNGSFEVDNGTTTTETVALPVPAGSLSVSLRVTDDGGWTGTDTQLLSSLPGEWRIADPNPDNEDDAGYEACMAIVNGKPAISYYYDPGSLYDPNSLGDLRYVQAADAEGSAWGAPVTVDSEGKAGWGSSLCIVDGKPAIAYEYRTGADLRYVRALDADGSAWGPPETPDGEGFVGAFPSLTVVNGRPAISYRDSTNTGLKYVRATDIGGSAWGAPLTLDAADDVGFYYKSLRVVNGNPAVSYFDATNVDLKYVRASNPDGSAWGAPQTIDGPDIVGQWSSMAVVEGCPSIAYYNYTTAALNFVRAADPDGAAWGPPLEVDSGSGDGVGALCSLALINGKPAVSHYDYSSQNLLYVRATTADGSAWGSRQKLDMPGAVGQWSTLLEVAGRPGICYYDQTNADLKYIRLY